MPRNCLDSCLPVVFGVQVNEWAALGTQEVSGIYAESCADGRSRAGMLNAANGYVTSGFGASILDHPGSAGLITTLGDGAGVQVARSSAFLSYRDPSNNLWSGYFDGDVRVVGALTVESIVGIENFWQNNVAIPDADDYVTLNPASAALGTDFEVTSGVMDMGAAVNPAYPVGLGVKIVSVGGQPAAGGVAVYDEAKGTRVVLGATGGLASAYALWASAPNTNDSGAVVGGIDDGAVGHLSDSLFRLGYRDASGALWSAYLSGPQRPGSYAVAALPDPATHNGGFVFCTNGDGGSPCLAVSNGTNWLRVALGTAVSAT